MGNLEGQYNTGDSDNKKSRYDGLGAFDVFDKKNIHVNNEKISGKSRESTEDMVTKTLIEEMSDYKNRIEYDINNLVSNEDKINFINDQISSYEDGIDLVLDELKKDPDFLDEVFPNGYKKGDSIPEDISYADNGVGTDKPIRYARNIFREYGQKLDFLIDKKDKISGNINEVIFKDGQESTPEKSEENKKTA